MNSNISHKKRLSSVIAASSGNLVEWFDFYIYGFAAVYFAHNFSNANSPLVQQIAVFGVFAAGFLCLPIGSIIFGSFADKIGRKNSMVVSIVFMAIGSFCIAFLPDKDTIGDLAIVLLLIARLIQGLAVGGEYGIAAAYLSEIAPKGKKGFYSSFQYFTLIGGQLLAVASISFLFLFINDEQMRTWGWRVLFFIGGILALTSLLVRTFMHDNSNEELKKYQDRGSFKELFKSYKSILLVLGITAGCSPAYYIITVYAKVFMINNGIDAHTANNIMLGSLSLLFILVPFMGALSDKIGLKTSLLIFCIFALIGIYPLFVLMKGLSNAFELFAIVALMCFFLSFYSAVAGIFKTTLFPPHVRALGTGFSYTIAAACFGGSANYIALQFKANGIEDGFFMYFAMLMIIAIVCVILIPKKRELD
ncbi:alpha-ketoglutarate permease [Campylobacter sp. MIT 12-8780]|uniref:MFS transporter n=1 Tax=unclassified Campylobacter TaxID=2593542 RepID=UPI00115CAA9C|nr:MULTISPECIES: MFS transporter [unclassified Campylobacter]NDJ27725.1 MFS transporter [Campylobacter sp. MIT 19-121]TQR41067.1 alpha-ketoglutarate permease [Campylobacter sp. MIT 12-8780]